MAHRSRRLELRPWLFGRALGMAAAITLMLAACRPVAAAQPAAQPAGGEIRILPGTKGIAAPVAVPPTPQSQDPRAAESAAAAGPHMSYAQAYRAVPFSRAEYLANPSYRNEAALALVFGQMPYTQIIKNSAPVEGRSFDYISPYGYRRPDGSHMNYNFFYPRPSVYRRY